MNDQLQHAGFLQTAFTQVEGELRSEALFRRGGVTATSAGSELPITGTGNGRLIRYRIPQGYPTIRTTIFEGWTILAGCMIRYAHRAGLRDHDWHPSLELVRGGVNRALQDLWTEVASQTNFLEGELLVDGAELYRARVTIVLGALSAYAVRTPDFDASDSLRSLIAANRQRFWLWEESAFPFLYSIAKLLENGGERAAGIDIFTAIMDAVGTTFTSPDTQELASPYYPAERILTAMLQLNGADLAELLSSGGSFIVRPTLDLLARRDAREAIAARWKRISRVPAREVRPTELIDLFSWRMTAATNITEILPSTQSWAVLQQEARELSPTLDALATYKDLLHYFVIVCPYRATRDVMKLLDMP